MDSGSRAVVIDCGSGVCRVGFAGDPDPKSVFPSVFGYTKSGGKQQVTVFVR